MRADLRAALKQHRADEVRLLRALIAAIDNAEAPPLDTSRSVDPRIPQEQSSEIQRLLLSQEKVLSLLTREIEERELAASEMDRMGIADRAEIVRAEARLAKRYIG